LILTPLDGGDCIVVFTEDAKLTAIHINPERQLSPAAAVSQQQSRSELTA
jgi:hypothetical protein